MILSFSLSLSLSPEALFNSDIIAAGIHPGFPLPGAVGLAPPTATPTTSGATNTTELEYEASESETPLVFTAISEKPQGTVECLIQECPPFLHSGLMKLFPGVSVNSGALTVITLSERTKNDMTGWSPEVEEERELLLVHVRRKLHECVTLQRNWVIAVNSGCLHLHFGVYSSFGFCVVSIYRSAYIFTCVVKVVTLVDINIVLLYVCFDLISP